MGYGMKCSTTPKTGVMQGDANTLQKGAAPPPPPTGAVGGGDASHLSVEVVMQTTEKNQASDLRKFKKRTAT